MAGVPYAAFYNMDMRDLDVEIGMPVSRELPGRGAIQSGHIPGGKAASGINTGPYRDMEPTYEALAQWMAERGLEPTGVAYEFYIDDPAQIPKGRAYPNLFSLESDLSARRRTMVQLMIR